MSQLVTRQGGCHCGKVRYEANVDLSQPVIACNCSICSRSGALLTFVPASSFKLLCGEDELADYQFGKKRIHHLFCRVCGIKSFGRGLSKDGPMVSINIRCLDEIDVDALTIKHFDGKSL